jgi:uncharacterized membrane protein YfcA
MIFTGYFLSFIMGITLGVLGAGGSILILPILVYFFSINPVLATSYSLIIVGITALIGSIKYLISKNVDIKTALKFSISAIIMTYVTRRYFLPIIPDPIYFVDKQLSKDLFILILFSLLMGLAGYLMIKSKNKKKILNINLSSKFLLNLLILLEGTVVGFLTGLVGAGGGFLIIPALVIFLNLNMKVAVGTSLLIIVLKSLIGVTGDLQHGVSLNFNLLFSIIIMTSVGILLGSYLNKKLDANKLKVIFGYFTLMVSLTILGKEVFYAG